MISEVVLLTVLPALLAAAAIWDLASFTIPNFLTLAVAATFAIFGAASCTTSADVEVGITPLAAVGPVVGRSELPLAK